MNENKDDGNYVLNIEFENVDGLKEGADVFYRGYKVGIVKELHINSEQTGILVKVKIVDTLKIPIGSDFLIFSADLYGKRAINIEFSESKDYIKSNTSVIGKTQRSPGNRVDMKIRNIKSDFANRIEILENSDSIIIIKFKKQGLDSNILRFLIPSMK